MFRDDRAGVRFGEPGLSGAADARQDDKAASLQAEVVAADDLSRDRHPLLTDRIEDRLEARFYVAACLPYLDLIIGFARHGKTELRELVIQPARESIRDR